MTQDLLLRVLAFILVASGGHPSIAFAHECEIKKAHVGRVEAISPSTDARVQTLLKSMNLPYEGGAIVSCDVVENPVDPGQLRGRLYFKDASVVIDNYGPRLSEIRFLPKISVGEREALTVTVFARTETEETYSKFYYVEAIGPQTYPAVSVRYASRTPGVDSQKRFIVITAKKTGASRSNELLKAYSFSYIGVGSN